MPGLQLPGLAQSSAAALPGSHWAWQYLPTVCRQPTAACGAQVGLHLAVPGKLLQGAPLPSGERLQYKLTGPPWLLTCPESGSLDSFASSVNARIQDMPRTPTRVLPHCSAAVVAETQKSLAIVCAKQDMNQHGLSSESFWLQSQKSCGQSTGMCACARVGSLRCLCVVQLNLGPKP